MKREKNMNKDKWNCILYCVIGILFFVAAILHKNYVFVPIGCCWIILGIINRHKNK